ncbi:hypothetical protein Q8A64_15475 [Oxalobacteraceae bacterium R-40]|uniref:Uncharacterized protein n=1 Tax=Keguizhuia sedimenti TaxID=3064264 RepID=A0ABU1BS17_9BURK|nr:hypothetical protein [Oxalobacteraceae bacterium R-40]
MSQPKHLTQEADIGSGERSPGQQETDKMIEQVPPTVPAAPANNLNQPGRSERRNTNAQSGNPP